MFNELYKKDGFYWGLKPSPIVRTLLEYIKKGKALDIGAGEGRNSVFLAKMGFEIKGIDSSMEGIKKALQLARKENVSINAVCCDLSKYKISEFYNVIISIATLNFLDKDRIYELILQMKEHTVKGGFNAISVFVDNPKLKFKYRKYDFRKEELKNLYKDWGLIEHTEKLFLDRSHDKPHYHHIASIIAQKL